MVLEFILITKWDEIPRALCMGDLLLSHLDPLIVHGRLTTYPLHQPHVDSRKVRSFRLDIHYLATYISLSFPLYTRYQVSCAWISTTWPFRSTIDGVVHLEATMWFLGSNYSSNSLVFSWSKSSASLIHHLIGSKLTHDHINILHMYIYNGEYFNIFLTS